MVPVETRTTTTPCDSIAPITILVSPELQPRPVAPYARPGQSGSTRVLQLSLMGTRACHPPGQRQRPSWKRERATSVALLLNRLSDRRFVAFEYHRVGLSGRRICLRPSSSSLAGTFFGWALTLLTTPNFLCRCLEHCPCMPLQIPGSWTLVRTVWNYRED